MITVSEGLTAGLREAIADMMPLLRHEFAAHSKTAIERAAVQMASTCRIWGFYDEGRAIGFGSYRRGGDIGPNGPIHLVIHPDYHGRWMTRPVLALMLSVLFNEQDTVVAKVRGPQAWRFVEKFGFRLKEDHGVTRLYEMRKADALPYRRTPRPRAA